MNFNWVEKRGRFETVFSLFINGIKVAEYSQTDTPDFKNKHRYTGKIYLPGLKTSRFYASSHEDIMNKLENAVESWVTVMLSHSAIK